MRIWTAICLGAVFLSCLAPPTSAQRIRRITEFLPNDVSGARIDDSGNRVVAWWQGDPLGTNPNRNYQLFLWDSAASSVSRLSGIESAEPVPVDITDDGNTVVFAAAADPLGTNADLSFEIFSIGADGSGLTQVTNFAAGAGTVSLLAVAGSGNRIAFGGDLDPILGNPSGVGRLFVINPNGTGQLGVTLATSGTLYNFSISDDGERLVFVHDGDLGTGTVDGQRHLYRIRWNRQELRQLGGGIRIDRGSISGDSQTIVYNPNNQGFRTTDWDETSTVSTFDCVTNQCSSEEALADDGAWVYFIRRTTGVPGGPPVLARIPAGGGTDVTLAGTTERSTLSQLRVAGGGSRLIGLIEDGEFAEVPNPDGSKELFSIGTTGLAGERITDNGYSGDPLEPAISPTGESVAFVLGDRLMAIDFDGSGLRHLTMDGGAASPSISTGGEVAFTAFDDLTAPTSCQSFSAGVTYNAAIDGSSLLAVSDETDCITTRGYTSVSDDGTTVGWQANNDLYVAPFSGGAEVLVDDGGNGIRQNPVVSGDGDWVVFHSNSDAILPGNTQFQVFRVPTDGSLATEALTADAGFPSLNPDVSSDGTRIVFNSLADFTGGNPDHGYELFLWEEATGSIAQLTDTSSCRNREPRISGNGRWVYFMSDCGYYGVAGDLAYRLDIDSGTLERITGTADGAVFVQGLRNRPSYDVDMSGDRAVLQNNALQVGDSVPGSLRQLYAIEFDVPAAFIVDDGDPTLLQWEADPRYVGYDVIRGDVAELAPGASAGDTDLGPVVCLETNSSDTSTAGFEDGLQPVPSQALFYLYRGRMGPTEPPTDWGSTSAGGERTPASGGCSNAPM